MADVTHGGGVTGDIVGNVLHDAVDDGSAPVKMGGVASTSTPAAVANGDRVEASFTPEGALRVSGSSGGGAVEGDTAHDAADSGDPVKVGGYASASPPADVDEGDRVNASFTLGGALRVSGSSGGGEVEGKVDHDAVDTANKPVKIGGKALSSPPTAVGVADMVNAYFDTQGRQAIFDGGESLTVDQSTPDNLNANANLQVGDVDVSGGNPVPVSDAGGSLSVDDNGASLSVDDGGGTLSVDDARGSLTVDQQGTFEVEGNEAHDDPDSGKPVKIGGKVSLSIPSAVGSGDRVDAYFDSVGRQAVFDGGEALDTEGDVAHDAADSGNPVKIGGVGTTSTPAGVDEGDRVQASFDLKGQQRVLVTDQVPGTGATNLGKAVDSAAGATDTGTAALAVRDDTLATLTPVDGDYTHLRTDSKGRLWDKSLLVDEGGDALPVDEATAIPANTPRLLVAGMDADDDARTLEMIEDDVDEIYRLAIQGKVTISSPVAPSGTTPVTLENSTPLDTSGTTTTTHTITNGTTFTLQSLTAGSEGDSSEKGSKVEVYYYDGASEHIVARNYVAGFTIEIYPNTSTARDGTSMTGDGSTKEIRLRRTRLSGGSLEVDSVLTGFES